MTINLLLHKDIKETANAQMAHLVFPTNRPKLQKKCHLLQNKGKQTDKNSNSFYIEI